MSEITTRKCGDDERLPSERKTVRDYRTRVDPFEGLWGEVQQRMKAEPKLRAKSLFDWLQENYVGRFPDFTRRMFERALAQWRSLHGPGKAVFFNQIHYPGRLAASDFTACNKLRSTIAGARFDHMLTTASWRTAMWNRRHCASPNRLNGSLSAFRKRSGNSVDRYSGIVRIRWLASRASSQTTGIARKCFPAKPRLGNYGDGQNSRLSDN